MPQPQRHSGAEAGNGGARRTPRQMLPCSSLRLHAQAPLCSQVFFMHLSCAASEIQGRGSHLLTMAAPKSMEDMPLHCAARAGEHSDGHPPHGAL
ncbi:hypothetical protein PVAP13_J683235 [Panicum virgatum]|nr:hypothetical protein PVAP13_J683235 [Panicum virgatum]